MIRTLAILLLLAVPAMADPRMPTDEEKAHALMRAFSLNGGSMVRQGSIDLADYPDLPVTATAVQGEPEVVVRKASVRHRAQRGNVCTRHGMVKITHGRGWRCKKTRGKRR
jgi:hypothetical protein